MIMYSTAQNYKIETRKGIIYTCRVVGEDDFSIKILTIKNEELILNKAEIARSLVMGLIRTEENGARRK